MSGWRGFYADESVDLIPSMQSAQAALADVQVKIVRWKNKVAERENIYEGVRPLTTKLLAAFSV